MREGLSADCKLDPTVITAIMLSGREHPCDRCNKDRKECRGYPRLDSINKSTAEADNKRK